MFDLIATFLPVLFAIGSLSFEKIRTIISTIFRRPNKASIIVRSRDSGFVSMDLDSKEVDLTDAEIESLIARLHDSGATTQSGKNDSSEKGGAGE
jgi:hypothetical protein